MSITMRDTLLEGSAHAHVTVLSDRCAGCQECSIRCPSGALSLDAERWVVEADDALCVGCRQCERTCPFSAIRIEGPMLVAPRTDPEPIHHSNLLGNVAEIRQGYASWAEANAEAERCLTCPDPTCVRGCPAHNDIPGFIAAIRDHNLEGAHRILQQTTNLSDICSRVCNQAAQCEGACTWSLAGGVPVAVGRLERFIADELECPAPLIASESIDLSVGIVGSGPAAIGAAWELVRGGASVTVYEKDDLPGGLIRWGIPDFTLPDDVAMRPWRQLIEAGVELRCGEEIRSDDVESLLERHDGLILAYGASEPLRLSVPGSDLDGVSDATSFLKGAKSALQTGDVAAFRTSFGLDSDPAVAQRVLVLGAGNTAMDVARSARRAGLAALCVDWVDERFALARPDELAEARSEGVEVRFLSTLVSLEGEDGRVARGVLATTEQASASGRPKVVEGANRSESIDLVVMAMGYRADPAFTSEVAGAPISRKFSGLPDRRWMASGLLARPASAFANNNPVGQLALGRENAMRTAAFPVRDRTWVVGDALVGPSTVVEAMVQGRRAASAVLDAMPARADHHRAGERARVLVCFESSGGTTAKVARTVGDGFVASGHDVRVVPIANVRPEDLASADFLVVGTWVEGMVVAKVGPAKAMKKWIDGLPRLGGKEVALFCTYAVSPKRTLDIMASVLETKGAHVVSKVAFGRVDVNAAGGPNDPVTFGRVLASRITSSSELIMRDSALEPPEYRTRVAGR